MNAPLPTVARARRAHPLAAALPLLLAASVALAAPAPAARGAAAKPDAPADTIPVVTRHEITVDGKPLRYTVTTGMMPLRNEAGETEAKIFFMAYAAEGRGAAATRPLMFSFNGGPGSSSVWLHLGALGPRRVKMQDDGGMPPPPYQLVDNPHTWLDRTDRSWPPTVAAAASTASSSSTAGRASRR